MPNSCHLLHWSNREQSDWKHHELTWDVHRTGGLCSKWLNSPQHHWYPEKKEKNTKEMLSIVLQIKIMQSSTFGSKWHCCRLDSFNNNRYQKKIHWSYNNKCIWCSVFKYLQTPFSMSSLLSFLFRAATPEPDQRECAEWQQLWCSLDSSSRSAHVRFCSAVVCCQREK